MTQNKRDLGGALAIGPMDDEDIAIVVALWERSGLTRPWNDPHKDIAFARASQNADVLVGRLGGRIVATAMVGHDGHRGTAYYVAVDPGCRAQGLGRAIMAGVDDWLRARGVWKINVLVRQDNAGVVDFYERLGFADGHTVQLGRWIDGGEAQ